MAFLKNRLVLVDVGLQEFIRYGRESKRKSVEEEKLRNIKQGRGGGGK